MEYHGKLYARVGGKYIETGKDSTDWDNREREIKLLRSSEQAAIRSQKESFEESRKEFEVLRMVIDRRNSEIEKKDKIIQSQKAEIEELKKENERLQGKVNEAFDFMEWVSAGSWNRGTYIAGADAILERWSKDNSINQQ